MNTQSDLSQDEVENVVRRSYQYAALYNTLFNFALNEKSPFYTGGWNKTYKAHDLTDASARDIPRPNNDSLYVLSMLDLRVEPMIVHYPVFSSRDVKVSYNTCFQVSVL